MHNNKVSRYRYINKFKFMHIINKGKIFLKFARYNF